MTGAVPGRPVPVVEGLGLGESPRWRDGRVWFCDWLEGQVMSVTPDGADRIVHAELDGFPICIDWDVEGHLLFVDGAGRRVLRRVDGGGTELVAELSSISDRPWNEIAAHPSGRVYVNGVGFDLLAGEPPAMGQIAVIEPDGTARAVAGDLAFPNGMVFVDGGRRLVVAESHAGRLTSFAVTSSGELVDRSTIADLPGSAPDGLAAAPDGSIWYADVPNRHCRRIDPTGAVAETVPVDRGCFSCALSPAGTLFVTATVWDDRTFASRRGVLLRVDRC
ncbi:MAG: SMP-30/gluconolactonase/LRE family protein [Actinomycetota bacterium]